MKVNSIKDILTDIGNKYFDYPTESNEEYTTFLLVMKDIINNELDLNEDYE